MREIKFRAWSNKTKTMYIPEMGMSWMLQFPNGEYGNEGVFELMQFTGLLDKNGKEIYEGDVIQTPHYILNGKFYYLHHKIIYNQEYSSFTVTNLSNITDDLKVNGNTFLYVLCKEEDIEVIGNVYDNPELCKS